LRNNTPACYGRSWTANDRECTDCDLEYDCRDVTRRRRQGSIARRITPETSTFGSSLAQPREEYGVIPSPRQPGETLWMRALINVVFGILSRTCKEAMLLAEAERVAKRVYDVTPDTPARVVKQAVIDDDDDYDDDD